MAENGKMSGGVKFLLTLAAFIIVVGGMRAAESLIVPLLLSILIAVICAPPMFWLQKKKIPTGFALLIVIGVVVCFGLAVAALVGSSIKDFNKELPTYKDKLTKKTEALAPLLEKLKLKPIEDETPVLEQTDDETPVVEQTDSKKQDEQDEKAQVISLGKAFELVGSLLAGLSSILTNGLIILITVIFMLLEASSFPAKLHAAFGGKASSQGRFGIIAKNINQYMAIKSWVSLLTGALIALWLWILGVDYPLMWGTLAFLFNYVPNIGSIIAAVPAVLLALIQLDAKTAVFAAAGYVVVNLVMGNVVEPRFMGKGLGLSTLVVFLSLVFWGWVFGPVGMLLSVPLTMTMKIALESNEDTRWIAILLGTEKSAKAGSTR
jgi:AI-2 transport protein TqsA